MTTTERKRNHVQLAIHTIDTAPEASRPILQRIASDLGTLPNFAASIASSPTLLAAFDGMRRAVGAGDWTRPRARPRAALAVDGYRVALLVESNAPTSGLNVVMMARHTRESGGSMDLKGLQAKAKQLIDRRGGTDSLKADAEELRDIAKGPGSVADKAKRAGEALKDPGAKGTDSPPAPHPSATDAPASPAETADVPGAAEPGRPPGA